MHKTIKFLAQKKRFFILGFIVIFPLIYTSLKSKPENIALAQTNTSWFPTRLDEEIKFPWNHSQDWTYNQSFHGSNLPQGQSIDIAPADGVPHKEAWVIAPFGGEYKVLGNDGFQSYIQISNPKFGVTKFLHLDTEAVSESLPTKKGSIQTISQGQVIARGYNGTEGQGNYQWDAFQNKYVPCSDTSIDGCSWYKYKTPLGLGTGLHIHWTLPSKGNIIIDGWTLGTNGVWSNKNEEKRGVGKIFNSTNQIHDQFNLILNSTFSKPFNENWKLADPAPNHLIEPISANYGGTGNVLKFQRTLNDSGTIYQNIYYPLESNTSFEVSLDIGNTTNEIQHINIRLFADYLDDTVGISCRFVIPPNAPLRKYVLRDTIEVTDRWDKYIRFDAVILNENSGADILLDNVSVEYRVEAYEETQCLTPHLVQARGNSSVEARQELDKPYSNIVQVYAGTNPNWWDENNLGIGRIVGGPEELDGETWYRIQWVEKSFVGAVNATKVRDPYWIRQDDMAFITTSSFSDVKFSDTFFDYIALARAGKLFKGFTSGSFMGEEQIHRKDAILVMVRWYLGRDPKLSDIPDGKLDTYDDVNDEANPAHIAVELAYEKGWIPEGNFRVVNGEFQVDEPITRAEFVYLLISIFKGNSHYDALIRTTPKPESDCDFPDIQDHPFRQEIIDACRLDLLNGFSDGNFKPDDSISRQEATKVLSNAYLQIVGRPFSENSSSNSQLFALTNTLTASPEIDGGDELFVASDALLALRWLANGTLDSDLTCQMYAVHEYSDGTQISTLNLNNSGVEFEPFSPLQTDISLTTIEINPITQRIYSVASSPNQPSQLYLVDPYLGRLFSLGEIKDQFGEPLLNVNGLEFTQDGTLLGYTNADNVRKYGVIIIDPDTGVSKPLLSINHRIYALAQHPESGDYWIATQRFIYVIDESGAILKQFKINTTGKIEAMDFKSEDTLLLSMRKDQKITLYEMDVILGELSILHVSNDNDIQNLSSIAWPASCSNNQNELYPAGTFQQFLPFLVNE